MRYFYSLLLLLVPILGVYTFMVAADYGWWWPENVSTYGGEIDWLFDVIMYMVGFVFILTEVALFWFVLRYSKDDPTKGVFTHGNHKLEMVWTAVPAIALLGIAFLQMGAWSEIKFGSRFPKDGAYSIEHPIAEVWASQFDWRFRYPGKDGKLGTMDDLESAFEFAVPANENVVFALRSRDVIHSFFVPEFRLKQDALPGHTIPVWFNAMKPGTYDLVCAELCGWGHYKMAGRVRVLPRPEYDQWMKQLESHWYSNGSEEKE